MTDDKRGQSVEEAQQKMWQFFGENYFNYKYSMEQGETLLAYNYLGRAMHPIMDITCPSHNWQPWELGFDDVAGHHDPKTIDDATLNKTIGLMNDAAKQFDRFYELSTLLQMAF
jgi:hypothetical protein